MVFSEYLSFNYDEKESTLRILVIFKRINKIIGFSKHNLRTVISFIFMTMGQYAIPPRFETFKVCGQINPTNPTQIWTLRANPILDPEGPTRPRKQVWFKSGLLKVNYRFELEFLKPFLRSTRPNWTRFWIVRANPTHLNPKVGLNPKKLIRFGRTDWNWIIAWFSKAPCLV